MNRIKLDCQGGGLNKLLERFDAVIMPTAIVERVRTWLLDNFAKLPREPDLVIVPAMLDVIELSWQNSAHRGTHSFVALEFRADGQPLVRCGVSYGCTNSVPLESTAHLAAMIRRIHNPGIMTLPDMDVADVVTALVNFSPESRLDVLRRACHELGAGWLRDALEKASDDTWYNLAHQNGSPPKLEPTKFWFDEQGNERCDSTACFCNRYCNAGECIHKVLPKVLSQMHCVIGKVSEK